MTAKSDLEAMRNSAAQKAAGQDGKGRDDAMSMTGREAGRTAEHASGPVMQRGAEPGADADLSRDLPTDAAPGNTGAQAAAREAELDRLLCAAQFWQPQPSADLMARVLADAAAEQPQPRPLAPARSAAPAALPAWWQRIGAALAQRFGGGGALAGLGGAALGVGLMIGLMQPAPVMALTTAFFDTSSGSVELMPAYVSLLNEVSADE